MITFNNRNTNKVVIPARVLGLRQEGGELIESGEPAAAEAQDPMMDILNMAMQAVEEQDPETAMQVCVMLVEIAGGGEEASMEEESMEEMPTDEEMGYGGMMDY